MSAMETDLGKTGQLNKFGSDARLSDLTLGPGLDAKYGLCRANVSL